jgi:diguanylate cyclase (GGDEF)-like protein
MKRPFGSRKIQAAPHDQPRNARRVSGTVRVPKSAASAAEPDDAARENHESHDSRDSRAPGAEHAIASRRARSGAHLLPQLASNAASVRDRVSTEALTAAALSLGAFAAHFLLPGGWPQLLVPVAPLALLWVARHDNHRMQWAVYAGGLWCLLAWLELIHPTASANGASGVQSAVYRVTELTALGVILLQLWEAARFMQHLSQRDPLTGLLNRRGFEELSATELKRAARYDRPIAFALLDVDRFKSVNDQYGHAVGDRVLRIVSEELLKLRTSDLAVRLGGDEFGLLMPETDAVGAEQLVSRLRQRIHTRMFEQGWPVTISAGVASSASCRRRLPDLIALADTRMYECKLAERG